MVGDSVEDIETANAAGTASALIAGELPQHHTPGWHSFSRHPPLAGCFSFNQPRCASYPLAAGGGNETSAAAAAPPPLGAVPTFSVDSLPQLQQRLAQRDTALGWGAGGGTTPSLSSSDSDGDELGLPSMAGAPPQGLDFLIFALTVLNAAKCSFPRIDGARFGTPPDDHPGDRVLHLACGNGALTKLLFSSGLQARGLGGARRSIMWQGLTSSLLRLPASCAIAAVIATPPHLHISTSCISLADPPHTYLPATTPCR